MSKVAESLLARVEALTSDAPPKGTPQMVTHIARTIKLTYEELKEAIAANPRHKNARIYRNALKEGFSTHITVEAIDLEALLRDQDVVILRGVNEESGEPYTVKQLKERPLKEAKKQGRIPKPPGPPSKAEVKKARRPLLPPKKKPASQEVSSSSQEEEKPDAFKSQLGMTGTDTSRPTNPSKGSNLSLE